MKHVPSSDANVFPEYILPSVVPLCHDKNEMVRSALARHIAEIAEESLRFLDLVVQRAMSPNGGGDTDDNPGRTEHNAVDN